jgi:hypothetical protein
MYLARQPLPQQVVVVLDRLLPNLQDLVHLRNKVVHQLHQLGLVQCLAVVLVALVLSVVVLQRQRRQNRRAVVICGHRVNKWKEYILEQCKYVFSTRSIMNQQSKNIFYGGRGRRLGGS